MASLALPSLGSSRVYLYDLNVFKPPEEYKVDHSYAADLWRRTNRYSADDIDFQSRVYARSGLSPTETHLPPCLNPKFCDNNQRTDLDSAMVECRMAVCGAVEGLLKKTGLRPTDIDILVTTCSIYCPTPSMSAMVVNAFNMRKDVQAWHLGGMGCSNGVVGVNLVADILKSRPNCNALFVTTETTTPAYYRGTERHRLVTNLLFRMGAAAVLLTNKPSLAPRAKYVLQKRVRVHLGQCEDAYTAIFYGPDPEGVNGIYLGKNVVKEASRALATAMTQVAPSILTWRQLGEAAWDFLQRRLEAGRRRRSSPRGITSGGGGAGADPKPHPHPHPHNSNSSSTGNGNGSPDSSHSSSSSAAGEHQHQHHSKTPAAPAAVSPAAGGSRPPYRPNFQESTIRHFLLHAGGAKVLDGLGESLQLDVTRLAPSRDVLYDFGNVSSSTTWYTLANVETLTGVKRGERILQVGVGSGIKCGVNVWKALRDVREVHDAWAHRLSADERLALQLERSVDVAHGWSHLATRAVFAVLMVLLAVAMHCLMLQRAAL